ncbi:LysR family transcriptional regulator [Gulosibacter sp. 10]|uniref:LysR family transcriptional regulator n=1 Tax=Gulosibacter sp. 10 TaxID=1255570 RepID=UPI000B35A6E6|nr:LysR family transcriptional regulator [Gulosibacter sp. 10]
MSKSREWLDWVQLPTLRLLVALSDAPSLSAAARSLGMAQPNASRAITTLERRTGLGLLNRSTRGAALTEIGHLMAAWAKEVVEAQERLAVGTDALSAAGKGELTVGASQTVAEHLAPIWISRLNRVAPAVRIVLDMENSERVIAGVVQGEYGIGFVESPGVPEHLHQVVIREDPLELVVAPAHPWAELGRRDGQVALAQLAETPLVTREPGSGTRAFADAALAGFDRVPPLAELNSSSAIVRAVRAGAGPTLLSRLAVSEELAAGRLVSVPIAEGPIRRSLRAVWSGPRQLVGTAALLLETVMQGEQ